MWGQSEMIKKAFALEYFIPFRGTSSHTVAIVVGDSLLWEHLRSINAVIWIILALYLFTTPPPLGKMM